MFNLADGRAWTQHRQRVPWWNRKMKKQLVAMNEGNAGTAADQIKNRLSQTEEGTPGQACQTREPVLEQLGLRRGESQGLGRAAPEKAGIGFIELHGNHYGPDLGYRPKETLKILGDHDIRVAGICGMFSADNDLSSVRPMQRQAAIDYIRRELEFAAAVGGTYLLVVPGAVGRPAALRQHGVSPQRGNPAHRGRRICQT